MQVSKSLFRKISSRQHGFTIVELLIVIVIIAILAAITIVAYNGIQERARYSSMKSDINSINKAIQMYHAENSSYPGSNTTGALVYSAGPNNTMSIPGLAPTYIAKMPSILNDGKGGYYAYIVTANGANYKLVRLVPSGSEVPTIEQSDPGMDPVRGLRGWGVWSPACASTC